MWKIKQTERVLDSEYVKVDKDDVLLPHGREINDFYKVTIKDCAAISVEPCRRDTLPAIALATSYLVDKMGVSAEESVVVCPVDPYVNDDYFEALKKLSDQADKGEANLALMGIEPT